VIYANALCTCYSLYSFIYYFVGHTDIAVVVIMCVYHAAAGKSKKLAKRNAALAMLNAIRLGGVEPNIQVVELDEYEDEDPIALV